MVLLVKTSLFWPVSRQLRLLSYAASQNKVPHGLFNKEPFKQKPYSLDKQSVILPGPERVRASVLLDDPTQVIGEIPGSPEVKTVYDVLGHGLKVSNDGPCIGSKPPGSNEYVWSSYSTVISRTQDIGSGFIDLGLKPSNESNIGIFSANREEFLLSAYSCAGYSMVLVPLYLTLGLPSIIYIINHAKLSVVITTNNQNTMSLLNNIKDLPTLKKVVLCEPPTKEQMNIAKASNIELLTYKELEATGKKNKKQLVIPHPDEMYCIPFTSGTTGTPKGAILTHRSFIGMVSSLVYGYGDAGLYGGTIISYLPPAHVYEICNEIASLYFARGVAFYSGEIKDLFKEIRLTKPTIVPLLPKLMGVLYMEAMKNIRESKIKTALLPLALWHKRRLLKRGKVSKNTIWDKYIFKHFQECLGGEHHMVTTTSAPVPQDVMRFYALASGAHLHECYGSTEVLGAVMTLPYDPDLGHVGGPMTCSHVKLADVPEMGYFSKEDCGEICIKGTNIFKGYLDNPKATKECLIDGWYYTGDIGTWLPNGGLKVIDRKKHLFKLSQGEYIAPEKIENIYKFSNLVLQILVDGLPEKNYVIVLVVPDPAILKKWLASKGYTQTEKLPEILASKEVRKDFLLELHKHGKERHLNSLEQARNMSFLAEPFTVDNDMLTPTLKVKRNVARKRYEKLYEKLYEEGPLVTSLSS